MLKIFTILKKVCLFILIIAPFASEAQPFTNGNIAVFVAAASASNTTGTIVEFSSTGSGVVNRTIPDGNGNTNGLRFSGSATSTAYLSNSNDGTLLSFNGANSSNTASNVNTLNPRGIGIFNSAGTYSLSTTYTGTSGQQTRSASTLNNITWFIGDQNGFYSNGTSAASPSGNIRSVKAFGGTIYAFTASASLPPVGIISAATGGTYTGLSGLANGATSRQDFYLISSGTNGTSFDVLYVLDATSATAGTIFKYSLVAGSWTANGTYTTNFGGFGMAARRNGTGVDLFVSSGTGATITNKVVRLNDVAGYNTAIAITTANNVDIYTTDAGTIIKGVAFAPIAPLLPLSLLSFNAKAQGNNIIVDWKSNNEINHKYYEVVYSTDGSNFIQAGQRNALVGSGEKVYTLTHQNASLLGSKLFYRLKMVSTTGVVTYSNIVIVRFGKQVQGITDVYPNPTTGIVTLIANATEQVQLNLIDASGKIIVSKQVFINNSYNLDLTKYANGIYILEATLTNGNKQQFKVVKK